MNSVLLPNDLLTALGRFLSSEQDQTAATAREICAEYFEDDNNNDDCECTDMAQNDSAGASRNSMRRSSLLQSQGERRVAMGSMHDVESTPAPQNMYTPCCSMSNASGAPPCCGMSNCLNSSMLPNQQQQPQQNQPSLQNMCMQNQSLNQQDQQPGQSSQNPSNRRVSRSQSAPNTAGQRDCQRGADAFCAVQPSEPNNILGLQRSSLNDDPCEDPPSQPPPPIDRTPCTGNMMTGQRNPYQMTDSEIADLSCRDPSAANNANDSSGIGMNFLDWQRQQLQQQQQQQEQNCTWLQPDDTIGPFEPNLNSTMIESVPRQEPRLSTGPCQRPAESTCGAQRRPRRPSFGLQTNPNPTCGQGQAPQQQQQPVCGMPPPTCGQGQQQQQQQQQQQPFGPPQPSCGQRQQQPQSCCMQQGQGQQQQQQQQPSFGLPPPACGQRPQATCGMAPQLRPTAPASCGMQQNQSYGGPRHPNPASYGQCMPPARTPEATRRQTCLEFDSFNETSYMNPPITVPVPQRPPCLRQQTCPPAQQNQQVTFREEPSLVQLQQPRASCQQGPRYPPPMQMQMGQSQRCPGATAPRFQAPMNQMGMNQGARCQMNQGARCPMNQGAHMNMSMGQRPPCGQMNMSMGQMNQMNRSQAPGGQMSMNQSSICAGAMPPIRPPSSGPRCPPPINLSQSMSAMNQSGFGGAPSCGSKCGGGRAIPMIFPDEMSPEERFAQRTRALFFETLVKDHYCPGVIQETLNGREDFNDYAFEIAFAGIIPPKPEPVDPMTMLEAIKVRIDYERGEIRKTYAMSNTKRESVRYESDNGSSKARDRDRDKDRNRSRDRDRDRDKRPRKQASIIFSREERRQVRTEDIDKHFASKHKSDVNDGIASFLKAENDFRNSNEESNNDFEANVNALESQFFGAPIKFNAYTATTTPID